MRMTSGSWRSALRKPDAYDRRVEADFALRDDRLASLCTNSIGSSIVRMCSGARAVDEIDERGERRALAAAGDAGDEHEAARLFGELDDRRRQAERFERRNLVRESDASTRAIVPRCRNTLARTAADAGRLPRDVDFELASCSRSWCAGGSSRSAIASRSAALSGATVVQRCSVAVDAHERRVAGAQVNVGGAAAAAVRDQLIKGHGGLFSRCKGLAVRTARCRNRLPPKPSERADTPGLGPQNCRRGRPEPRVPRGYWVAGWPPPGLARAAGMSTGRQPAVPVGHDAVDVVEERLLERGGDRARARPAPIWILSTDRIGVISAAVPTKNTSSAM